MPKDSWMQGIVDEVRQRALSMTEDIGARLADGGTFGHPPAPPKQPTLEQFITADPQTRQAMLQGMGAGSTDYISGLQNEAVSRYGALAAKIMPALQMESNANNAQMIQSLGSAGTDLGVQQAHADLVDLLGVDPFATQR